jgi:hypothetical protein
MTRRTVASGPMVVKTTATRVERSNRCTAFGTLAKAPTISETGKPSPAITNAAAAAGCRSAGIDSTSDTRTGVKSTRTIAPTTPMQA